MRFAMQADVPWSSKLPRQYTDLLKKLKGTATSRRSSKLNKLSGTVLPVQRERHQQGMQNPATVRAVPISQYSDVICGLQVSPVWPHMATLVRCQRMQHQPHVLNCSITYQAPCAMARVLEGLLQQKLMNTIHQRRSRDIATAAGWADCSCCARRCRTLCCPHLLRMLQQQCATTMAWSHPTHHHLRGGGVKVRVASRIRGIPMAHEGGRQASFEHPRRQPKTKKPQRFIAAAFYVASRTIAKNLSKRLLQTNYGGVDGTTVHNVKNPYKSTRYKTTKFSESCILHDRRILYMQVTVF